MISKPDTCIGCPLSCSPLGSLQGFVQPSGDFKKGVLIIGDTAGKEEEQNGIAFVGKAGHYLWGNLKRVGLDRDDFRTTNVLSCRTPDHRLIGNGYEQDAIKQCTPLLDAVIHQSRADAKAAGQTFVILTLGKAAFKRVMGLNDYVHSKMLKLDYMCYPFYSAEYQAWVIAGEHPGILQAGRHHLLGLLQFAALRAVDIATNGFSYVPVDYSKDPDPFQFRSWVDNYFATYNSDPANTFLSYDIETPWKRKVADEADLGKEEDDDYTILRVSFAYKENAAVSLPWTQDHMPQIARIFASPGSKVGWNNELYDDPRIMAQVPINGDRIDAMLGWHVLNTALPKGLGFVTPFYAKRSAMWKHLSEAEPAMYSAKDADMTLQNWLGIQRELKANGLFDVFDRHVTQMNKVFTFMSEQGVRRNNPLRDEAEVMLKAKLADVQSKIESVVPQEARAWKIYKKTPKSLDGLVQITGQTRVSKRCSNCGTLDTTASHFRSIGKKRLKGGDTENPCVSASSEKVTIPSSLWALPLEFKLSSTSLQRYQKVVKHAPIIDPKEKRITFDDKAIKRLRKKYPKDLLYPLIGDYRKHQKLLGTYIGETQLDGSVKGGLPIGKDGKVHCTFSHNPSTLRSACQNPNLQNLPRPKGKDDPATIIRKLIVAEEGNTFLARDYSGIEAVLVGYFANDPGYVRLAKQDVHSFYTAYALHELDPKRISANDLPLLSWDDNKLFGRLAEIKKEFKEDRNSLYKHLVHGANFMQGAKGAAEKILKETEVEYPVALVKKVMDIYYNLFPQIKKWHTTTLQQADHDGYLRNPFGYIHRFYRIYEWDNVGGQWQKEPGPDANAAIAYKPQSTAAGIIKEAMMRLYFDHYELVGKYLRLLIHDEVFTETPLAIVHEVDAILKMEMEKPIMCMPLPPEWGMGEYLSINTEEKIGPIWGEMK